MANSNTVIALLIIFGLVVLVALFYHCMGLSEKFALLMFRAKHARRVGDEERAREQVQERGQEQEQEQEPSHGLGDTRTASSEAVVPH
ncbi:hypothetical protein F5Y13DRAFT_154371 [Hypoxylon sp. FL1857]|nr:hypothetical protein F5Y13DRAFT_154371 [Hypoxylon sp. FL1857]